MDDLEDSQPIHQVCSGGKFAPGWTTHRISSILDLDELEDETWDLLSLSYLDEILDLELTLE